MPGNGQPTNGSRAAWQSACSLAWVSTMPSELTVIEEPQTTKRQGVPFFQGCEGRILAAALLGALTLSIFTVFFYYIKFARLVDQRLTIGLFSDTIDIFAAPRTLAVGDATTLPEVV